MKVPRSASRLFITLLTGLALITEPAYAAMPDIGSDTIVTQVKAAYLFKFGNYVQWPPPAFDSETSPIVIGVLGDDQVAEELARISMGRSIGKHPVIVRRFQPGESISAIHMLFIGKQASDPAGALLAAMQGQPVLCVTDENVAAPPGSAINFVLESNRLRFDVSLPAAENNNLQLSASLLSVARKVHKGSF